MEPLLPILVSVCIGIPVGALLGIIAFARTNTLRKDLDRLREQLVDGAQVRRSAAPHIPSLQPQQRAVGERSLVEKPAVGESVAEKPAVEPAPPSAPRVSEQSAPVVRVEAPVTPPPVTQPPIAPPPITPRTSPGIPRPATPEQDETGAFESLLGRNLLAWAGVGLLFLGVVFFVKYAYDQSWFGHLIGPRMRVVLVAAAGTALAGWGWHCLRQGMAVLGQSAVGGGLAILQIAVYAAAMPGLGLVPTPLIDHGTAFALLVAITAAGVLCARRLDALSLSLIALIGGLLAPVLLSDGGNGRDVLFTWLLVLDLGVLAVAIEKRWRALDVVAAVGTGVLAWGWLARHYTADQLLPTMLWFAAFHLLFLALPLLFHVRTRTPVTVERVALLLGNLAWFLGMSGELAGDDPAWFMGVVSAMLAPLYLLVGFALRRRIPDDRLILPSCIALSIGLLTMALGNLLPVDGVAVAWAVESAVLLHLGYRYRHALTRVAALLVTGVVLMRLIGHLPEFEPGSLPFCDHRFWLLMLGTLALAAQAVIHRINRSAASGTDLLIARICGIAALTWLMVCGQLELAQHLDEPLLPSALWWLLGGAAQLAGGQAIGGWSTRAMPWTAGLCALIAGGLALAGYLSNAPLSGWPVLNIRWLACAGAVALLFLTRLPVQPLAWIIAFLAWSLEGPTWCRQLLADPTEAARVGSFTLTAAWMLAAGLLLGLGLRRRHRALRIAALMLCALVAGKLLLIDLAQAGQLWRILAFMLVGVLFLAGSWAYHRLLRNQADNADPSSPQPSSNLPNASGS